MGLSGLTCFMGRGHCLVVRTGEVEGRRSGFHSSLLLLAQPVALAHCLSFPVWNSEAVVPWCIRMCSWRCLIHSNGAFDIRG